MVSSPRALLGKSTEKMYLPRQDKFEGYSQFPRPQLPPEAKNFGSFLSRMPGGKAEPPRDRESIPTKELLEQ